MSAAENLTSSGDSRASMRETARSHARYTPGFAKASEVLADGQHGAERNAHIAIDEEMNRPAGFILDKGSYQWDVIS